MNIKTIVLTLVVLNSFLSSAQSFINKTIDSDGLTREYSIYIPPSYDGTSEFPLLFNFHGGNDRVASWQAFSDMRPIADTANFILVYPQARPLFGFSCD
jgi:polyhydroxybutyrate depolymerase